EIDGAIGPATAGYVSRAIKEAAAAQSQCLIVQLDTPGGLLDSTKDIVRAFYASTVPIVVYVAPSGANAGSAGCFITLAADIATMAPNTSIGAAHPVELGGGGEKKSDDIMTRKLESFAVSYIEAIAEKRHRNVDWAKSAVRDSASLTAEKALELKVIDLIARDVPDLLRQLDGREAGGRVLRTAGADVERVAMLARERVFHLLWRPEVMFVLMLIAIYGIIGELSNPGAILPGVAGLIALVLALYMASVLPVSIAGVTLILLAAGLFIIDVFAPTHGVLTAGGIVSFFLGSLMLFEKAGPAFHLSLAMIVPATVLTAVVFVFMVGAGLRAQRLPVQVGRETLPGRTVAALTPIGPDGGKVLVDGERWNACSDTPVAEGQGVEIVALHGLTLKVKPKT
ncbi:MAG: nodulation protein NfeD, partial [Verrucomicrobia bacterium]|nr:nodulation protein NfeD [Verrucomicrobiota bacterium]